MFAAATGFWTTVFGIYGGGAVSVSVVNTVDVVGFARPNKLEAASQKNRVQGTANDNLVEAVAR